MIYNYSHAAKYVDRRDGMGMFQKDKNAWMKMHGLQTGGVRLEVHQREPDAIYACGRLWKNTVRPNN